MKLDFRLPDAVQMQNLMEGVHRLASRETEGDLPASLCQHSVHKRYNRRNTQWVFANRRSQVRNILNWPALSCYSVFVLQWARGGRYAVGDNITDAYSTEESISCIVVSEDCALYRADCAALPARPPNAQFQYYLLFDDQVLNNANNRVAFGRNYNAHPVAECELLCVDRGERRNA